jgi:hypothetical protein
MIVIAHRYASKVYLIEIVNNTTYKIIDSIITKFNNITHLTESFQIHNTPTNKKVIYLISYTEYLIIIDIENDNKLKIMEVIKMNDTKTPYHGIKINKDYLYLTPSNKINNNNDNIIKFNLINKKYEKMPLGDITHNYRMKDIIFITDEIVIIPIVYKQNNTMINKNFNSDCSICLFSFPNLKLLDKIDFTNLHFDLGTSYENYFFITAHDEDGGNIYIGKIINNKIVMMDKKAVAGFPHSIDIYNNKIAYVSYSTSKAYIHYLSEFIEKN